MSLLQLSSGSKNIIGKLAGSIVNNVLRDQRQKLKTENLLLPQPLKSPEDLEVNNKQNFLRPSFIPHDQHQNRTITFWHLILKTWFRTIVELEE